MADEKSDRTTLKYVWVGSMLKVTDPESGESEAFDFNELPEELDTRFWQFGRRTKLGNFAADSVKAGRSKLSLMRTGFAQLRDGDWTAGREKLPAWLKGKTYQIRALAELKEADEDDIKATLAEMPEAQGTKILANPQVVAKAAEYAKAAKSRKTVDLSDFA